MVSRCLWTARDIYKFNFLRELANLVKDSLYPILIGGDFNLLRFSDKKSQSVLMNIGLSCLKILSLAA